MGPSAGGRSFCGAVPRPCGASPDAQGHVWFLTIFLVLYTKIQKMDLSSIQNRSTRVSLIPPPRDGSIRAIRRSPTKFRSSAGFGFGVRPDSDSEFGRIRSSAGSSPLRDPRTWCTIIVTLPTPHKFGNQHGGWHSKKIRIRHLAIRIRPNSESESGRTPNPNPAELRIRIRPKSESESGRTPNPNPAELRIRIRPKIV